MLPQAFQIKGDEQSGSFLCFSPFSRDSRLSHGNSRQRIPSVSDFQHDEGHVLILIHYYTKIHGALYKMN